MLERGVRFRRCALDGRMYELGVEFGQSGLTGVVEDQDCVDHI